MMRNNLAGRRFGKLTVIRYDHTENNKNACWLCICDCGNLVVLRGYDISSGHTKSCGCYRREFASGNSSKWWNGGKAKHSKGYTRTYNPEHPRSDSNGYVFEHIVVAEGVLGRSLNELEVVHHINGNKRDNRPENLMVFPTTGDHIKHHRLGTISKRRQRQDLMDPQKPNPIVSCACGCGTTFLKYDSFRRPRKYVAGHNNLKDAGLEAKNA